MQKTLITFLFFLSSEINLVCAQSDLKTVVDNAFLITRMAQKWHAQPRAVDDSFSLFVYNKLIDELDPFHVLLAKEDSVKLAAWQYKIDDAILNRQTNILKEIIQLYSAKMQWANSQITALAKTPFIFSTKDSISFSFVRQYALGGLQQDKKLEQILRWHILERMYKSIPDTMNKAPALSKKYMDSLEVVCRKKVARKWLFKLSANGNIPQHVGDLYCKAVAMAYDPHSDYYTQTEKELFESYLGNEQFRFGFSLDDLEYGGVAINDIQPASPAFKSGLIHTGDKIISLQWEGHQQINVAEATAEDVREVLVQQNHALLHIELEKLDGTVSKVSLIKEVSENDSEEDNLTSYVLNGNHKYGYISLPVFYTDWENPQAATSGCANDVAKEILKLQKENIQGLIIDLRYNGGGSMQEAADLAGIFIDAGPVAQIKMQHQKPIVVHDANRGIIYNGPLVILVNSYSASASEMVAGVLQDYNRAVIVGSPTYGKATGQIFMPLDTNFIPGNKYADIKKNGWLKITTGLISRVTGKSAQLTGVEPDIYLPDILETLNEREKDEVNPLPVKPIEPNKYYKALQAKNLAPLRQKLEDYISGNPYFKTVSDLLKESADEPAMISLTFTWPRAGGNETAIETSRARAYTVQSTAFDQTRLSASSTLAQSDAAIREELQKDPTIESAFEVLEQLLILP